MIKTAPNQPAITKVGTGKLRRPGIGKIVTELRIKHPGKSENALMAEAKALCIERDKKKARSGS